MREIDKPDPDLLREFKRAPPPPAPAPSPAPAPAPAAAGSWEEHYRAQGLVQNSQPKGKP